MNLSINLQSKDAENRYHTASSLGYTDDKRAIKPLIKVLSDTDEEVQEIAFFGLRNIGQSTVEDLIQTLKHPDVINVFPLSLNRPVLIGHSKFSQ